MGTKTRCALMALTLVLVNVLCAYAQLVPETSQPNKPPAPKRAQIVIQTSPNAQVYLDDVFKGQASEDDRLVKELKIVATLAEPPGTAAPRSPRAQGPTPVQVRENPKDGLKYVLIPPGTFQMGRSPGDREYGDREYFDSEKPHQVTITKGFWLGQTEVTVGAYKRFAGGTGKAMPEAPSFNPG